MGLTSFLDCVLCFLCFVTFPYGVPGQVLYVIVSIQSLLSSLLRYHERNLEHSLLVYMNNIATVEEYSLVQMDTHLCQM